MPHRAMSETTGKHERPDGRGTEHFGGAVALFLSNKSPQRTEN
jgi:hypothetical protein